MGEREQERKSRKRLRNPEHSSQLLDEASHRHHRVTKCLLLPTHSTKELQPEPANSRVCIEQF